MLVSLNHAFGNMLRLDMSFGLYGNEGLDEVFVNTSRRLRYLKFNLNPSSSSNVAHRHSTALMLSDGHFERMPRNEVTQL
jgi:hypothetical protein